MNSGEDYDVPPSPRPIQYYSSPSDSGRGTPKFFDPIYDLVDDQRDSAIGLGENRLSSASSLPSVGFEELNLSRDEAIAAILKVEKNLDSACNRLLSASSAKEIDATFERQVHSAFNNVITSLRELLELCKGSIGSADRNCDEKAVPKKLLSLLEPVDSAFGTLTSNIHKLDRCGWNLKSSVEVLHASLAVVRHLISDCGRLITVIQANSSSIFNPDIPVKTEDSMTAVYSTPKPKTAPKPKKNICVVRALNNKLTGEDRHLLDDYKSFVEKQCSVVQSYVSAYTDSVSSKGQPVIYVEKIRQVVVSAQALVHVTDTLHRHLKCESVREGIYKVGASLCESLKSCVLEAKKALETPGHSKTTNECVNEILHYVKQVKLVILHAETLL